MAVCEAATADETSLPMIHMMQCILTSSVHDDHQQQMSKKTQTLSHYQPYHWQSAFFALSKQTNQIKRGFINI